MRNSADAFVFALSCACQQEMLCRCLSDHRSSLDATICETFSWLPPVNHLKTMGEMSTADRLKLVRVFVDIGREFDWPCEPDHMGGHFFRYYSDCTFIAPLFQPGKPPLPKCITDAPGNNAKERKFAAFQGLWKLGLSENYVAIALGKFVYELVLLSLHRGGS